MEIERWGGGVGGILFFFFNDTATTEIYTLSLHDALPISPVWEILGEWTQQGEASMSITLRLTIMVEGQDPRVEELDGRSEEHTSELQSQSTISYAVFCLKKKTSTRHIPPLNSNPLRIFSAHHLSN